MSLINDALKRAAQVQRTPANPGAELPLRPVDYPDTANALARLLAPVAIVCLLVATAVLLWQWWGAESRGRAVVASASYAAPDSLAIPSVPLPAIPVAAEAPAVPAAEPVPDTAAAAVEPVAASAVATAPAEPPAPAVAQTQAAAPVAAPAPAVNEPPAFKLMGVFGSASRPAAIINRQTVYVGDEVDGARVLKIKGQSVTLQFAGETKTYHLR